MSFKTNAQTDRSVYEYLLALDCPRALTVWLLYTNCEHDQLTALSWDPLAYNGLVDTRDSLAATKFLSKASFLRTSFDRKKVAIDSFFVAEQQCSVTNKRIFRSQFKTTETHSIISMMAWKISDVLYEFTADELIDSCDWGPGASTSKKRRNASKPNKYISSRDITPSAYDFVKDWMHLAYPSWDIGYFCIQSASKIVTVPKNSKTDRTIAIEPDLNLWFQKGLGSMISRRLRRVGIDLSTQEINQERARIGSKYNSLATVDFSAASDTISLELCRSILPRDWFSLLYCFRSTDGVFEGHNVHFEKMSSMGNGFTFELESLIFWSLAICVSEYLGLDKKGISVFGDDVTLPSEAIDLFSAVAEDLGFLVNRSKSYSSGYFRESCGSYWYNGIDVKPIYLKEILDTPESVVKLTNSVRRLSHRRLNRLGCDRRLRRLWTYLSARCASAPRVSDGFGDCGVITNSDDPSLSIRPPLPCHEGIRVRAWVFRPTHYDEVVHWGVFLTRVRQIGTSDLAQGNKIPRALLTTRQFQLLSIPRWYDLGDWF